MNTPIKAWKPATTVITGIIMLLSVILATSCSAQSSGDSDYALACVKKNGKYGFIDKTDTEVIPCKYDYANNFSEGLAEVELNGKWGFIDKTGKLVIPCKYDDASYFSEGLAKVQLNKKWLFINKTGAKVISCDKYSRVENFADGMAEVHANGKCGFIDKTGKEVIPCKYDMVSSFSEGLADFNLDMYKRKGMQGFVDKTGKEIFSYDAASQFTEGLASVELNDRKMVIDKTGKEVFSRNSYQMVGIFSEGIAAVFTSIPNGKIGFIDRTGKEVIPCIYDMGYLGTAFSEGLAAVKLNGKSIFIDKTGKEVISCEKYKYPSEFFSEGMTYVRSVNGKYGFIDKMGKKVIPCKYESATSFKKVDIVVDFRNK